MKRDQLDNLYKQNSDYSAKHDGTFWILSDANGWGLACDEPVYRVWKAFDGRPTDQVIDTLSTKIGVSAAFIESTAKVLTRAGMLIPSMSLPSIAHVPSTDLSQLESLPLVSVIILASRQARGHLEACLPSVIAQTYPNLEIILVDNQTTDDSVEFTKENFPQVKIISTPPGLGFGGANNYAMKRAKGDFFFLVNEDTEMEPDCMAECVKVMARSDKIAIAAAKMKLFYMRAFINSLGNSTHSNGKSHDNFIGYLDVGQFDDTDHVFTACFGAAMLRRSVVEEIGYMDERYFVYFDDVDWAFRARIHGYDVVAAPRAIVYHKFNATVDTLGSMFKLGLTIHNRLRFAWKNFDINRAWQFMQLYRDEDRRVMVWAKERDMYDVIKTYRETRRKWLLSLPEIALSRWRTRRSRHPDFSDDAVFALADSIPRPVMYGRYPVIIAPVVRDHYMKLEIFKPHSPPAPKDLIPSFAPETADVLSLADKARMALKEKGIGGLLKEIRNYVRWLIISE